MGKRRLQTPKPLIQGPRAGFVEVPEAKYFIGDVIRLNKLDCDDNPRYERISDMLFSFEDYTYTYNAFSGEQYEEHEIHSRVGRDTSKVLPDEEL